MRPSRWTAPPLATEVTRTPLAPPSTTSTLMPKGSPPFLMRTVRSNADGSGPPSDTPPGWWCVSFLQNKIPDEPHHTKEEDCQQQQKQQLELNVSHTSQDYYTCNNQQQQQQERKKERKNKNLDAFSYYWSLTGHPQLLRDREPSTGHTVFRPPARITVANALSYCQLERRNRRTLMEGRDPQQRRQSIQFLQKFPTQFLFCMFTGLSSKSQIGRRTDDDGESIKGNGLFWRVPCIVTVGFP
uniref:Uncharacterized protein n=1 Tax=Daphnia galeata TaxID=27404 RepID=A0A8J2WFE3_9CRUS|nr:unnamed protein product [Daphnia galeata]